MVENPKALTSFNYTDYIYPNTLYKREEFQTNKQANSRGKVKVNPVLFN
jgi:hypothetical protein